MIKVDIIDDEIPSREKLKRFLKELDHTVEIIAEIYTATKAIELKKKKH